MSSTRTAPRTTTINKTLSTHHTNGSANSYDINDSSNTSEFDSNLQRSVLMKNLPQSEGIYRNPRFIHAITVGLLGQPVVIQTNEQERYHGILETISPNGDVLLSLAHRIDNNNNDIMNLSTSLIDLFDTVDNSVPLFELRKRAIQSSNIVEMIALDIDLTGNGKCILDENPKVNQLEDDRFNRMEHFYGTDEIDPETLEDLDLGDDGKAGYDPEDMFHTNREKFNTKTDFDESKYTNVPVRQMTADELAEVDKKVSEIERGTRPEDVVDEDDAGVKRPSEYNQTHNIDDGNSNTKTNQSSRIHPNNERRPEFRADSDYNQQPKRGNWREQRPGGGGGGNNRRGGQNNYSANNSKQNQRSDQTQYTSSRSSEQTTNNRQQQYKSRNNRYTENLSPHEGRDSPLQITNDETTRGQRINSGSFSQGQNSGPTSPSTVPARTIYSRNSGQPIGRNSPAPYTGSSSSRNNSTTATSPPPPAASTSYQTNSTGTGNYSQQSNNKITKKQSRNEQQLTNDEIDQPKQQRNQQQNSSNNQSNTVPPVRPSQLHTQQIKQQQQQQQQQNVPSNNNVPPPLTLPNQDDHSSSHESINPNQSDPTIHLTNAPIYSQHTAGTPNPGNGKGNSGLNPEADEFVPVFTRESNSRPESRGASTSSMPVNTFIPHAHPQALHLLQQQQQQQQTQAQQQSMIQATHPQNTATLYQSYYQPQFANIPQFANATQQQMSAGMMGTPMMSQQAQQQLAGSGPNTNNPSTGGMTTPNGGAGPTYKPNNNQAHSGDTGNNNVNNVAPKKAVVSVQRAEQSSVPQQQQVAGATQMVYPAPPLRYYQPEYMTQQANQASMQLQQIPFYYSINTPGIIQAAAAAAAGVGPHQNIMIPSGASSGGPAASAPPSIYYQGVYPDPRMYMYPSGASVNPGSINSNWQLTRSPPHQQQQQQQQQQVSDQQRAYSGGQNVVQQVPPPSGAPNANGGGGRSASTSGPSGQTGAGAGGPPMTPQYTLNGSVPTAYAYGPPTAWYPAQSQVSSPQTNMPPQVNAYGMMFDPSQQAPQQQQAYVHANPYEAAYFQQAQQQAQQQQQQQQQQQPPQQGLDTVPTGSYNR